MLSVITGIYLTTICTPRQTLSRCLHPNKLTFISWLVPQHSSADIRYWYSNSGRPVCHVALVYRSSLTYHHIFSAHGRSPITIVFPSTKHLCEFQTGSPLHAGYIYFMIFCEIVPRLPPTYGVTRFFPWVKLTVADIVTTELMRLTC